MLEMVVEGDGAAVAFAPDGLDGRFSALSDALRGIDASQCLLLPRIRTTISHISSPHRLSYFERGAEHIRYIFSVFDFADRILRSSLPFPEISPLSTILRMPCSHPERFDEE